MILAVVDDPLFLSKIQQTAQHVGVAVKSARPADLPTWPSRTFRTPSSSI